MTITQVEVARLLVLRKGVQLEAKGMKRRGRSCTQVVRMMFNLPCGTRQECIEKLEEELLAWGYSVPAK